jgi:hypothetical protein
VNVDGNDPLAQLAITEEELLERFGEPVTPPLEPFTWPGPVSYRPLELDDGQIVCLLRDLTQGMVFVFANPKDLDRALCGLGLEGDRVSWRKPSA